MSWTFLLGVALGGAIGASLRFLTVFSITRLFGVGFPYGTMTVNILGSFVIGAVAGWLMMKGEDNTLLRGFVMTGLLGGFTTFSAFSLDVLGLIDRNDYAMAALYVIASVVLSVGAAFGGWAVARGLL